MSVKLMDVDREYEKDKNLRKEDVKILKEWLEKQPHLPKVQEFQLLLFLQSCYYRIEAAKVALDNFFTVRTLCPEIFRAPTVEELKQQLQVGSVNGLPQLTPEGYAVICMRLIDPNPEHYNCIAQMNLGDLNMVLSLHQQGTCQGIVSVFDTKGLSFGHLTRFNLVAMKKYMFYVQEAVPIRIKGIHYINCSPILDKALAMTRPFLKKEMIDMITFHSTLDSLYKKIPREILPEDYGGQGPSLATLHEKTKDNLLENIDFFKWMDTLKVDESKRPGKPKNASDIFGVDGTFKKLEVD